MSILYALTHDTAASYAEAFQARDCTSWEMRRAIGEWFLLYYDHTATEDSDPCQQIPYTVVRKLTRAVFSEYGVSAQDGYAAAVLRQLEAAASEAVQMALIGGESLIKPVPAGDGWRFPVVNRANVLVFGRDERGAMTDIGTAEHRIDGRFYYTLLERRTVDANGYLTIRNRLYRSERSETLGCRVALGSLEAYARLPEEYTYPEPVFSVGLAQLRTPMANCIDGSAGGVSVYAAAVGLIRSINRNEAQLSGEFERGESRIITSADLLRRDQDGKRMLRDHVFVGVDDDIENVGMTIFSPQLREQSFLNRKQAYLRDVENIIGLKRGLLSEVEAVERTATEITSSEGDYNLTVVDFQKMWEAAVRETLRICGVLGQLYRLPGAHALTGDEAAFDWGNGVLFDEEKTWEDYKDMVARGLLKPEIALGWRFNLPTDTEAELRRIRQKYMPDAAEDV